MGFVTQASILAHAHDLRATAGEEGHKAREARTESLHGFAHNLALIHSDKLIELRWHYALQLAEGKLLDGCRPFCAGQSDLAVADLASWGLVTKKTSRHGTDNVRLTPLGLEVALFV